MRNIDAIGHVRGSSIYLDDIAVLQGCLHAVVFASSMAHAKIVDLDITDAMASSGVKAIYTAKDIPGENQIGGIVADEVLLAEEDVHFIGQPIAIVIAETAQFARKARKKIRIEYDVREPILDARKAKEKGQLLVPSRCFESGDVDRVWQECAHIFEGEAESGGQEHVYLETQSAYAYPKEHQALMVYSSTQGPSIIQKIIARILGVGMHLIEVDVQRLGGAFGGKEDQAVAWAALAAMSSYLLQQPVKLVLSRSDDLYMTGKRHPYSSDFRIGLSESLKILGWEVTYYQNGGAAADLSPAIMERTLFHASNAYFIPNVKATAHSCRTNLPPNTAFRGFGAPQAMFVMESAIAIAAEALGVSPRLIQERNLMAKNETFHYGQLAEKCRAQSTWSEALNSFDIKRLEEEIASFNKLNSFARKALSLMPICFGISFTKTSMNQARALVHIYQDGSVGISTGAVEMGQGVNTKLKQVASRVFSVGPERIKLESTNTSRVANASPTAASSGADLNGKALELACEALLGRLKVCAAEISAVSAEDIGFRNGKVVVNAAESNLSWDQVVEEAFLRRINLSEKGHYASPRICFDKNTEKGHPFTYHVYGTAITTVLLDCLRGIYSVEDVSIVHDFGKSMNTHIDLGQIEGGLVQGISWMTMEEVRYNDKGQLLSNSLSTYKIPDIYSVPKTIVCKALQSEGPELAILRSKAIGEPPLMYGIGSFFALQQAVKSFNPDYQMDCRAPFTPEKILMALYTKKTTQV